MISPVTLQEYNARADEQISPSRNVKDKNLLWKEGRSISKVG